MSPGVSRGVLAWLVASAAFWIVLLWLIVEALT